jgi:hypothetical protein
MHSVAVSLLLAGCSGGDQPRALPTLTATSPPSAVAVPVEARQPTPVGAAAFVRFYFAQVSRAFSDADVRALEGLSDPECGTCKNYVATAAKFRRDGQRVRGTAVRVLSAEAPPAENGFIAVDTYLDAPARQIVRPDGSVLTKLAADPRYHVTAYVKLVSGGWVVRAVKVLK